MSVQLILLDGDNRLLRGAGNGRVRSGIFPTEVEPVYESSGGSKKSVQGDALGPARATGRPRTTLIRWLIAAFLSLACLTFSGLTVANPSKTIGFYLLVSKNSPLTNVTAEEVKKLYRRKTNELQGKTYTPVHYGFTDSTRKDFSESVLEWKNVVREEELLRLLKFRNERTVPIQVISFDEMINQVREGGTVGYVRIENVRRLPEGVRAIPIL